MKSLLIVCAVLAFAPQGWAALAVLMEGSTATLTVTADGSAPFTYQWKKDGTDIPGATSAQLVLSTLTLANSGVYTVVVSNEFGSTLSDEAVIVFGKPVRSGRRAQPRPSGDSTP